MPIRISRLTGALFALCLGSSGVALAQTPDLQATLQGRYAAMKTAMGSHDGPAISALLTNDFVSIDSVGHRENAKAMIDDVLVQPNDPNKHSTTTILSVHENGDTATVDQRYEMNSLRVSADGTKSTFELVTLSTDVWVNIHGAWLMRSTQTNQIDMYKNGQRVLHQLKNAPT